MMKKPIPEALACLPSGSRQIADFLLKEGYKGRCRNAKECPLARYLMNTVDVRSASGTIKTIVVGIESCFLGDHEYRLPPGVIRFRDNFDGGMYPELMEEPRDARTGV